MRKIFINDFGRLRSGWRLLAYIALVFIFSFFLTLAGRVAYAVVVGTRLVSYADLVAGGVYRIGLLIIALAAGYLCARGLEELPWKSLGLTFHKGWLRDLAIGSAVGFASLVVAVGIAMLGSGLRFSINDAATTSITKSMLGLAGVFVVAALAEEALFRGYGLQTMARAGLAWVGVLLTLLLFGLAHEDNPNVVPLVTFTNTALAGLWLAVAYLRTRSLWLPLGVHWSWNWALGWFFGLPVSGMRLGSHPLLKASDAGPFWLTGGSYGIEGGVACTISLALFTFFLWRTRWLSATPELKKLTSEENPATPSTVLSIR
ncbi:MAG TPA: CPBP family intramembrane glutamic endopeptidase [Pyrinomonadaceae bacterium]|nr:CPBP family intramembrane glutamic endopeptidase [Pyrinomonadaceae bacterium]